MAEALMSHPSGGGGYAGLYEEHVRRIGEVDLYYTDWASTGGRTILLVHGIAVQSHTWDPIAAALVPEGRVLCPDLRGHGRSGWAESGYAAASFADDLAGLLDELGIVTCDIVGHSLGARVALALAARWKGKVEHLVLSDGGPELASAGLSQSATKAGERLARRGFTSREEALASYEERHPEWQPIFRELHADHQLRRNWAGKLIERSDPDLYWVTRGAGKRDDAYLWDCAAGLLCPTLLAWGARSPYFNAALVETYRQRFGGRFTDLRFDTGHYVPREQPDLFVRAVRDFLRD